MTPRNRDERSFGCLVRLPRIPLPIDGAQTLFMQSFSPVRSNWRFAGAGVCSNFLFDFRGKFLPNVNASLS